MSDMTSKHVINLGQLSQTLSQTQNHKFVRLIINRRKSLPKLLNCTSTTTSMLVIKTYILILLLSIQCHKLFASNLPLLSGTLRTFQVHACDGEELKLECLPNTVISIYLAQYGRYVPSNQLCPTPSQVPKTDQSSSQSSHNSSQLFNLNDTSDCLTSDALRYSLLQKVESSCREQRICKFMTSPQSFGGIDPCPGVRKYAEIAFKCRPNTFYNKVICEGDRLRLKCLKSSRIVIYSASFGSTPNGVPECPQLTSSQPISQSLTASEECQVSYATETVMSSCHGRKKCSLDADIGTFGDPGCAKSTRLHLKVVYTCVPKDVLKELDIGITDNDKVSNSDILSNEDSVDTGDYTGFVEEPRYIPDISSTQYPSGHIDESNYKVLKADLAVVPTKKTFIQSDIVLKNNYNIANNISFDDDNDVNCTIISPPERVIGFISEWISAVNFIKKNTERFILYLLVSFCGALVCFLIVLSSRLYVQKRKAIKKVKEDLPTCSPFGALSENPDDDLLDQFDGVTTLTEPLNHSHGHNHLHHHHHHSIEVVRYGNPSTSASNTNTANRNSSIRRQNSDTNPRSMSRNLNNYYYN